MVCWGSKFYCLFSFREYLLFIIISILLLLVFLYKCYLIYEDMHVYILLCMMCRYTCIYLCLFEFLSPYKNKTNTHIHIKKKRARKHIFKEQARREKGYLVSILSASDLQVTDDTCEFLVDFSIARIKKHIYRLLI